MMAISNNKGSRFAVLETEEPEGMADEHRPRSEVGRFNELREGQILGAIVVYIQVA